MNGSGPARRWTILHRQPGAAVYTILVSCGPRARGRTYTLPATRIMALAHYGLLESAPC